MALISIDISEQDLQSLNTLADQYGISVDALVRSSFEVWLSDQHASFSDAADYVLAKNADLYKHLA